VQQSIYTRQGDRGATSVGDGRPVSKSSHVVRALGALDEAAACLGVLAARREPLASVTRERLCQAQRDLALVCALLASLPREPERAVAWDDVRALEHEIDVWTGELPPLREFVLPGGTPEAALLHVARTVVRRAERETVAFAEAELGVAPAPPSVECALAYLNRLSDWLFTAARVANLRGEAC